MRKFCALSIKKALHSSLTSPPLSIRHIQLAHGTYASQDIAFLLNIATADSTSAFFQDYLYTLAVEQLDPIVSPNKQSSHMHRILGQYSLMKAKR